MKYFKWIIIVLLVPISIFTLGVTYNAFKLNQFEWGNVSDWVSSTANMCMAGAALYAAWNAKDWIIQRKIINIDNFRNSLYDLQHEFMLAIHYIYNLNEGVQYFFNKNEISNEKYSKSELSILSEKYIKLSSLTQKINSEMQSLDDENIYIDNIIYNLVNLYGITASNLLSLHGLLASDNEKYRDEINDVFSKFNKDIQETLLMHRKISGNLKFLIRYKK